MGLFSENARRRVTALDLSDPVFNRYRSWEALDLDAGYSVSVLKSHKKAMENCRPGRFQGLADRKFSIDDLDCACGVQLSSWQFFSGGHGGSFHDELMAAKWEVLRSRESELLDSTFSDGFAAGYETLWGISAVGSWNRAFVLFSCNLSL